MYFTGGGGTVVNQPTTVIPNRATGLIEMPGVCPERSLIEIASGGMDGVPISAVVKLLKLAYCFEHWDVFDVMVDPIRRHIRVRDFLNLAIHRQTIFYILHSTFKIF